jgi:2-dehydro-3-deoxyphosphogluconate aldolase/(4S)-4-hydroxy-2-oxoglutarate aldolase
MKRDQGLQLIAQKRIIAIVRGVAQQHIIGAASALYDGGIPVMEVTLNTPGALDMISALQQEFGDRMFIGAGTILDMEDAQKALDAGASFLVTPNTDEEVIRFAAERGIPIYPGAATPTEIVKAWKAGATAVKIFPLSSAGGLKLIKELQGPLSHIPMIAVGGVNEHNIGDFLDAGCCALGIGGSLFPLQEIANGSYDSVRNKAALLSSKVQETLHENKL